MASKLKVSVYMVQTTSQGEVNLLKLLKKEEEHKTIEELKVMILLLMDTAPVYRRSKMIK